MDEDLPDLGSITVLKNGKSLGPYEVDEVFDYLESGFLDYNDVCLREGAIETERLSDILDWDEFQSETGERAENPPAPLTAPSSDDELAEDDLEEPPEPIQKRLPGPDEILYAGHPSLLTYPFPLVCIVAGIAGGVWLYPISSLLMLSCFFCAVAALAYISVLRFTNDYLISPKRIEVISGLLARSSNEVRIEDLRAINVTCRGLLGTLGIGTVDFFSTGDEPEVRFRRIWAAKEVKGLVRKLQDGTL